MTGAGGGPKTAIVVGAGIVGLSTAWFLQDRGVDVTVVDRTGVAAGSSWGNAGWIAPSLAIPLNEPSVFRSGLQSLLSRTAPLRIPITKDAQMWHFLVRFAAHSRRSSWWRAVRANLPLNDECIKAFNVLTTNGVDAPVNDGPITAAFRTSREADSLVADLRRLEEAGQSVAFTRLSGEELREQVPLASRALTIGVRIDGQPYVDPGNFVEALGRAVVERGATLHTMDVTDVVSRGNGVAVCPRIGDALTADVAVIATGAWLSQLVRRWVRVPVQAGRGYSFTVPVDRPVPCPIYLLSAKVACTPYQGGLRVAGTMEFHQPEAPLFPARVDAIVASARPLLDGVHWAERTDVWVGPRPLTPDGRALIGELPARGIYVAGGHGMWGLAQGPVTGQLLAEQITTGRQPAALHEFEPAR